ncbi:MAG: LysM peptidoglycan-binding domain-containing protein [Bacteroides sp.]|nr:LysM peptidoglycan-binding domain-containing protein [Bacteroides sp.]MBD5285600.1 LysM peptidoglycan-binding domain-containing protein [Bacteroides sp.]
MKKLISTILLGGTMLITSAAPSILTLKNSITDNSIQYPESFETDTHKMLQNWYLRNYAVLNENMSSTPDVNVPDEVYIQRLSKMPTDIEMPYNQVVRSYINMYTQRRRQLVENMLGMSLYYMPIFEEALERKGLPLELRYLPVIESALNPDAVSRAGATGLWQFMLPTARGLGLEVNTLVDERRDPYASSEAAASYLKQLYEMYNDWSLAIAAYNCGPGNVNKALRRAGVENNKENKDGKDFWSIYYLLPQETRGYVPAFIAANYVMTYYNEHNISPALARRPIITDSVHVTKRVHLQQISDVLDIPIEELRVLNPQFRKDIIPGNSRPYSLVLPSMQVYSYLMSEDSIVNHNAKLYARRDLVEPTLNPAEDPGMEYTTKRVTKTHVVKRGETLSKIASAYGVSVADIKKWNKLKRNSIAKGKKLKIFTYERVATGKKKAAPVVAESTPAVQPDSITVCNDSIGEPAIQEIAQVEPEKPAAPVKKAEKAKPAPAKKAPAQRTRIHTVKKGDNLYRISKMYKGVTVDDIKKLNGLKNNDLQVGQKLKIPRN